MASLLEIELAGAVTDNIDVDSQFIDHRQKNIGLRCVRRTAQMEVAFEGAAGVASQQHRDLFVAVNIRVPHGAAIQNHRVIQKIAIPIWSLLQFIEEVRKQTDVIAVDLRKAVDASG